MMNDIYFDFSGLRTAYKETIIIKIKSLRQKCFWDFFC